MDFKNFESLISEIELLDFDSKVEAINTLREMLHRVSPFKNEPVDFVRWVKNEKVVSNDYNPNKVAPPEMRLLEVSIVNDGYTQPIVAFPNEDEVNEVVDGFHRSRVGKESKLVNKRVFGYLPIVAIRSEKTGKSERIASTIRHNRARGKHQVSAMSEIVIELKNRNWKNERIARELGMDEDEILRLCQISGLENLFKDSDFSRAWISEDSADTEHFEPISDEITEDELAAHRIPNESDSTRIFHTYEKWEATEYGFFDSRHPTLSPEQCKYKYKMFLEDLDAFEGGINLVFLEWPNSCEHNLTNRSLNRIAWIGQAAAARVHKIPSIYCSGFSMMTKEDQDAANELAFRYLNLWLKDHGLEEVDSISEAMQDDRQVELY